MRWPRCLVFAAVLGLGGASLGVPAAGAATVPVNDNPGGAKGDPVAAGLVRAGHERGDDERRGASARQTCANGAPRKGVWFRYTATDTFWLKVDTRGSSYEAFFVAMAGRPAPDHLVTCGETFGEVHVRKGTTYWFMVHAANPGSGGGTLRIRFAPELPPPKVWVHVNPTGVAKVRTGAARISGPPAARAPSRGCLASGWRSWRTPEPRRSRGRLPRGPVGALRRHADQLAGGRVPGRGPVRARTGRRSMLKRRRSTSTPRPARRRTPRSRCGCRRQGPAGATRLAALG